MTSTFRIGERQGEESLSSRITHRKMFGEQKIIELRIQGMCKEVGGDEGTGNDWVINF